VKYLLSIVALGLVLALVFGYRMLPSNDPVVAPLKASNTQATVLKPPKTLVNFTLQDTNGNTFTQDSLLGHWTLMFFGYADCPDICPTTLGIVSGLWRSYPTQMPHPKAHFVFVTLNPSQDTPAVIKKFLAGFNSDFIGVTGSETEINNLSKSANIFSWTDPKLSAAGKKVIDHSATLLLFNPEGQLHALFSPPYDIETLKNDLQIIIDR